MPFCLVWWGKNPNAYGRTMKTNGKYNTREKYAYFMDDLRKEKESYVGNDKWEHIRFCVSYLSSSQLLQTKIMENHYAYVAESIYTYKHVHKYKFLSSLIHTFTLSCKWISKKLYLPNYTCIILLERFNDYYGDDERVVSIVVF